MSYILTTQQAERWAASVALPLSGFETPVEFRSSDAARQAVILHCTEAAKGAKAELIFRASDIPPEFSKLPDAAKAIARSIVNLYALRGGTAADASKAAWVAVKRRFKQSGGKWVEKDKRTSSVTIVDAQRVKAATVDGLVDGADFVGMPAQAKGLARTVITSALQSGRYTEEQAVSQALYHVGQQYVKDGEKWKLKDGLQ